MTCQNSNLSIDYLVKTLIHSLQKMSPHVIISPTLERYISTDFKGFFKNITEDHAEIIFHASQQPQHRQGFLSEKPQWYIINNWNKLAAEYQDRNRKEENEYRDGPDPCRPATRHSCLKFIGEAHAVGIDFTSVAFKRFYSEAGFSPEEIKEICQFKPGSPKQEFYQFLNDFAKRQRKSSSYEKGSFYEKESRTVAPDETEESF